MSGIADTDCQQEFRSLTRRRLLASAGLGIVSLLPDCSRRVASSQTSISGHSKDLQDLTAALETQLPLLLAQAPTVPAVSMAIVADARLVWRGAFGVKDRTSNVPVDPSTVFEAASVSKTVFAYVVMKLCEKGVMNLDMPLTRYMSHSPLRGDARLDQITPRMVLSHTTGFQNWRSEKEPLSIHFTPGERWGYSGEGYSWLQSVVTHLTGHVDTTSCKLVDGTVRACATDFAEYMKANLLMPLGMTSSSYLYQEGMARPHGADGKMIADRKATPIETARYGSAGGLHTTPSDYAKFLIEILAPKPADEHLLNMNSMSEMLRPQIKVKDWLSWGLGWAVEDLKAGRILGHSGDNPGFKALAAAWPQQRAGFIIMTNGDRGYDEIIAKVVKSEALQRFLPTELV